MDTHNLATVITPNILKEKTPIVGIDESSFLAIEAVNSLIECNDQMCEVSPLVPPPSQATQLSPFSQNRYQKTSNPS